jgi:hypothetical protein
MEKENYIKEVKAGLILLSGFSICIGSIYLARTYFKSSYWYYVLAYLIASITCIFLSTSTKKKYKVLNKVCEITSLPLQVSYLILTIFSSLFLPILGISIYASICIAIPNGCFLILDFFGLSWPNSDDTVFFIKMTVGVLLAVLFNFQIRKITFWIIVQISRESPFRHFSTNSMINYLLSSKNIQFIIYSAYVLLLFAVNYQSFESSWLSENLNMDKAILQSFVTFIAFDRTLTLLKDLEFKPSDLLRIIVNSFLTNWQKTEEEKEVFNT